MPTITTNYNKNHFSNLGKNHELLLKCKILGEYSSFVDCVRKYSKINNDFTIAIDKAVNECIEKGILKDLLIKYSAEVKNMLLTEFDEEKDWAIMAKGYKEIGYEEGRKNNIKEIIKNMLLKGKTKAEIIDLTGITNEEYEDSVN